MVLNIILAFLAIVVLLIASFQDFKTREVPDWISYGFLFSVLGLKALFAIEFGWKLIASSLLGLLIFFLLALLFYHTNQWGGADSKLLMGMGALIGADFVFYQDSWELPSFFFLLLIVGAVYGLVWSLFVAVYKRKDFIRSFKKKLILHSKEHKLAGGFSLLFMLPAFWINSLIILALFPILSYYLFLFVSSVEESCFLKLVSTNHLSEGDWLAKDVKIGKKRILIKKSLEKVDIKKLMNLEAEGKLKSVLIKEGLPFVPNFLFAYVILLNADKVMPWVLNIIF